jgi:hypothetical protein
MALVKRSRNYFMSTANRTRASMSFQQYWKGNSCPFALIVDAVMARPAVDPDRHGSGETVT